MEFKETVKEVTNKAKEVKLTKEAKFLISWVILSIVLLIVCYPLGHLSVMVFAIYTAITVLPKAFHKWLDWMNTDDK